MCGILYAKLRESNPEFKSIFESALSLMAYRGQDNISIHQENRDFFGHARLSILDLSERSNQPIVTPKHVILFKGEIYNYKQLVPEAASDTLAIANLAEKNIDMTHQLAGMYAVLTYQRENGQVKVLRDFYGEKPLYFYHDEKIFIVSSTLKSIVYILQTAFQIKLNLMPLSLYEFMLSGYIREPRTIYEKIHALVPAHSLTFIEHEWKFKIKNHFKEILHNTSLNSSTHIKNCLSTTDVVPALLLSSGVDSTYVLSQMESYLSQYEILTYKANHTEFDESALALTHLKKIVSDKQRKINIIENHEDILTLYAKYPTILEQPSSDGMNLFNILWCGKQNNQQLKLVIVGTGGDELYGGYHSFKNYKKIAFIRKYWYLQKLFPKRYQRFFTRLPKESSVEAYYFLYRICPYFLANIPKAIVTNLFDDFVKQMKNFEHDNLDTPYKKIKLFESFDYMRNQLLRDADNISLYCGFEARNPLLSVAAYLHQPDFKQTLKSQLADKHDIHFGDKKGFTLCDKNNKVNDYLFDKIHKYNEIYNLFPQHLIKNLTQLQFSDFYVIRKIYILLSWLQANDISVTQLQGFNLR